jgi:YesN/AraC family two-component response regulator
MIPMFQILIVEDSRLFRHVFKETLRTRFPSFDIAEAANGEEALRFIEHSPPDLIFMDIRLPEVNGLALIRKIKARHPKIVSIILTGYDTEYREDALKCADYFLSKRSTSEDVFALIETILLRTKAEQPDLASLGQRGKTG